MTVIHHVRVHRSEENLAREDQLAHKLAEVAADPVAVEADVVGVFALAGDETFVFLAHDTRADTFSHKSDLSIMAALVARAARATLLVDRTDRRGLFRGG